jgi:nucleotide-binding universal stress UspA family protein
MTTRHILVPLDGTKNAEASFAALEKICEPEDELTLLSVSKPEHRARTGYRPGRLLVGPATGSTGGYGGITPDVPRYADRGYQVWQRQADESKDYLEGLAEVLRAHGFQVQTEVLVDENPDNAIVEYARTHKPTFIAMLRRTHPGLSEMLFGSIASSVVRADVAPVLFVPPAAAA